MKKMILLLILLILIIVLTYKLISRSSSDNPNQQRNSVEILPETQIDIVNQSKYSEMVNDLDGLSYFKFVDDKNKIKAAIIEESDSEDALIIPYDENYDFIDGRVYSADSEDLAEGGISGFLRKVSGVLETEGVTIKDLKDISSDGYAVSFVFNGEERFYQVYDASASKAEKWSLSSKVTVDILNELLRDVSSHERAWGKYGGNDGIIIFLTLEQKDYLDKNKINFFFNPLSYEDWVEFQLNLPNV